MLKQIWWVLVLLTIYSASLLNTLDNLVSPHRSILDISLLIQAKPIVWLWISFSNHSSSVPCFIIDNVLHSTLPHPHTIAILNTSLIPLCSLGLENQIKLRTILWKFSLVESTKSLIWPRRMHLSEQYWQNPFTIHHLLLTWSLPRKILWRWHDNMYRGKKSFRQS